MIEEWVISILKEIEKAGDLNKTVEIHIDRELVKEIADEYKKLKWIEIY